VVALIIRCVIEEPPRGHADHGSVAAPRRRVATAPFSLRGEATELAAVARSLFLSWPAANVILGLTVSSFASYGAWVFIPAYFNRALGLDFAAIGVVLGLAGSVPVALGTLLGGFVTDALGTRSARWYALVPAAGLIVSAPLYVLAFLADGWRSAALLLAVAGFFQYVSLGPTFGIVQNVVGIRRRATATALLYLCLTLLALAGGPPFTGALIDRLAEVHFAHPGAGLLANTAEAIRGVATEGGSSFRASCPGGAGSPACAAALAAASSEGLIVTFCLFVWAAAHYVLGAIGLERQMQAAADQVSS
jgi:hypothetical protein